MQDYGNVQNTFSDYLLYDERKGRVLHSRYLNKAQFYEMWRFHFNKLRPEFSDADKLGLVLTQRLTRGLMGYLRFANGRELSRCMRIDPNDYPNENCREILENQLNFMAPSVGQPVLNKMGSWRDASKSLNYIQAVAAKIHAYGLDYPGMAKPLTDEQKVQLEEQLYGYFTERLYG